uniref:Uncharacterized protein n=1 Tax=Cacopsylla melanoneura TaxID=428564 RepID=A0A8D8QB22_9HEMI
MVSDQILPREGAYSKQLPLPRCYLRFTICKSFFKNTLCQTHYSLFQINHSNVCPVLTTVLVIITYRDTCLSNIQINKYTIVMINHSNVCPVLTTLLVIITPTETHAYQTFR